MFSQYKKITWIRLAIPQEEEVCHKIFYIQLIPNVSSYCQILVSAWLASWTHNMVLMRYVSHLQIQPTESLQPIFLISLCHVHDPDHSHLASSIQKQHCISALTGNALIEYLWLGSDYKARLDYLIQVTLPPPKTVRCLSTTDVFKPFPTSWKR